MYEFFGAQPGRHPISSGQLDHRSSQKYQQPGMHETQAGSPSGCDKITFANPPLGFDARTGGQIRIDGVDIQHLNANEVRAALSVPRSCFLMSPPVRWMPIRPRNGAKALPASGGR
jgi:hypothetical protein